MLTPNYVSTIIACIQRGIIWMHMRQKACKADVGELVQVEGDFRVHFLEVST